MALEAFSPAVQAWFSTTFAAPTEAQSQGWPAIARGEHTLICAPTGSGKTLAAFLWGLDRLATDPLPGPKRNTRLLYISPLRALAVDVEKNLRAPMRGIALAAKRLELDLTTPTVGIRSGDTAAKERRQLISHPPDLLITTPESLYLMLTSKARETLVDVETVIIDEIHAVAATKRGTHLALTLERLDELVANPPEGVAQRSRAREGGVQRIGLSATQRPLSEIARFLGGREDAQGGSGRQDAQGGSGRQDAQGGSGREDAKGGSGREDADGASQASDKGSSIARPVTVVDAGVSKELDLQVIVPVEDMGDLGKVIDDPTGAASGGPQRSSIWPAVHPRLLELIQAHRSTIVFVNARRLAERLATRLNELAAEGESRGDEQDGTPPDPSQVPELVRAHHGSLSKEQRLLIEDDLKAGRVRGLVATSSLELGIDMGAVDLVIQVESPGAVSRGLQRVGRAGHQVGEPSRGRIFPKHRSDLVEAAVVAERMESGLIETTRVPANPLDVLAQQIVAMVAMDDWEVEHLGRVVRRSASFSDLSDDILVSVLDLLAGRYPSEEFSELRPRIVWDRVNGVVRARKGAQRLAVTNGGTIPDRGLFGVFLPDGTRVGELDEEMVYESRVGETFLLGATTWRIEDIGFDRVTVTPAPGQPGKMPFWHGDGPGRPLELGQAMGAFVRELRDPKLTPDPLARVAEVNHLDDRAATNLVAYLEEQAEATGAVPDDRTIVVERFRDEIGDWRVCLLSPFGTRVHAPWAMAIKHRLAEVHGLEVEMIWGDDGIVIRLPEAVDTLPTDVLAIEPEDIDELVVSQLPSTAMFASRFRECSARALLLPRRRPGQRTPLWQQRQKAADLLAVAARYPTFPMLLETTRECINDVFDLPALREVLGDIRSRKIRLVEVETQQSSPFAQSLLFGWIAVYMYEGDAPLAERRAAALALDRDLLRDLLGAEELRELLDPNVLADVELELQRLVENRQARDVDELHDAFRLLGPLDRDEVGLRCSADPAGWLTELIETRRIFEMQVGGQPGFAAVEDGAKLRDALGVALPPGLPAAFTDPVEHPLVELTARYARTHGPFTTAEVSSRLGVPVGQADAALEELERRGRLVRGEFRPEGTGREWCDDGVLRQLRRRSLAALRAEVEPVEGEALARFLPEFQGVGVPRRGIDGLADVLDLFACAALPASVLERDILPARMADYRPADLDALCGSGELMWVGAGAVGASDGRIRLVFREQAPLLLPAAAEQPEGAVHDAIVARLTSQGASFWPDLAQAAADAGAPYDDPTLLAALWDLVWAGYLTNDSLAPVRALVAGGAVSPTRSPAAGGARRRRPRPSRLARQGPPAAIGRWSLVQPVREPLPSPTEIAHAKANALLGRYGILTREAALAEGAEGGFAGVYPVLKALEDRGTVRRGYFVSGLGAAQFALPGTVDRLRSHRADGDGEPLRPEIEGPIAGDDGWPMPSAMRARATGSSSDSGAAAAEERSNVLVLAATDPAQPFGAALDWPTSVGRPSRSAGAYVVIVDGRAAVFLERGAKSLVTFPCAAQGCWADALGELVKHGRLRGIEIGKIDGEPAHETPDIADQLRAAGFVDAYRGLTLRR